MQKRYLCSNDAGEFFIVTANFVPPNSLGEVPEGEEAAWLSVQDIEDEFGRPQRVIVVNQNLKSQILAQRAADAAAKQAEKEATQYQRDRKSAYPPIGDQLDAIYKKLALNDSTEYDAIAAQIAAVKTQFPKPE